MNFAELIGQKQVKEEIAMRLKAFEAGQPMPSLLFVAPRGKGKSTFASLTGITMRNLTGGAKRYFELNCASVKNLKQFWHSVVIPVVNDRDVTILLDESHMLPNDVMNFLLTGINPNAANRNSYTYDDMTVDIDLKRQTFFFATTDVQRMAMPLVNRCRRIDLQEYSTGEMSEILLKAANGISIQDDVLHEAAATLRGTPRQAIMLANDMRTFLAPAKRSCFLRDDWDELKQVMGILPLGLTRLELAVLRVLEQHKDCSLTRAAATLQMTPAAVQKDLELYLLKCNLMQIDTGGRNLTQAGRSYLRNL
jgi:Holliday junction resolvasome RuvABC ATP-dependent DNA helicase subunit